MTLRAIPDDSNPLPLDQLQAEGDRILGETMKAAGEALVVSVQSEFLFIRRPAAFSLADVKRIRGMARDSAKAWARVDALLSELLNEVEKAKKAGGAR